MTKRKKSADNIEQFVVLDNDLFADDESEFETSGDGNSSVSEDSDTSQQTSEEETLEQEIVNLGHRARKVMRNQPQKRKREESPRRFRKQAKVDYALPDPNAEISDDEEGPQTNTNPRKKPKITRLNQANEADPDSEIPTDDDELPSVSRKPKHLSSPTIFVSRFDAISNCSGDEGENRPKTFTPDRFHLAGRVAQIVQSHTQLQNRPPMSEFMRVFRKPLQLPQYGRPGETEMMKESELRLMMEKIKKWIGRRIADNLLHDDKIEHDAYQQLKDGHMPLETFVVLIEKIPARTRSELLGLD